MLPQFISLRDILPSRKLISESHSHMMNNKDVPLFNACAMLKLTNNVRYKNENSFTLLRDILPSRKLISESHSHMHSFFYKNAQFFAEPQYS